MKFRNYCIVVMGSMESVKDDIVKVAESQPRYIDAKGVLIATFASVAAPAELQDFFSFNGRSFFLFDLDKDNSGVHMDNEKLNSHLFGFLVNEGGDKLKEMSDKLMGDISATTKETKSIKLDNIPEDIKEAMRKSRKGRAKTKKSSPKINISEMTKTEREGVVNRILDKGFERLTNSDKNILKKISELK
jgi:hypothetical protein